MKKILIIIISLICFQSFSQDISKDLMKKRIGQLNCTYTMTIKNGSDTSYYVSCYFQNMKYQHITDLGYVWMWSGEERDRVVSELNDCLKYVDDKTTDYSVGQFSVHGKMKGVWIYDDSKYVIQNKKTILKWINWLESVPFP